MANKSYASSEIGGDESRYTQDPETAKDFRSAYQQVSLTHSNTHTREEEKENTYSFYLSIYWDGKYWLH